MDGLPYLRAGSGPSFVLVHGYLGGAEQWRHELDHFSNRYDVIAPNLPGFGAAADRPACDTIAGMAEAVFGLLDELAVGDFILLGHSMGGMVVQEMARMRPQSVLRLILYGTGPLGLMPDRFEPIATSRERLLTDGVEATIGRIGATWFKRGAEARGYRLVTQIGACARRPAAEAGLGAMAAWDGRSALTSLTMPTLVVWGDADRSYRWPQVETLWTNLPDVRLSVIPGASHAAHLEKPALFHSLIEDFLSEPATAENAEDR
ncbi:alpha/beta fold hydrolase [Defluviimonas salinarum]|uniref:Alpha/beta hydrolase n=1 Tax=Defluviimonas salinarum TaxID=2992147 RepID=A0ABT3J4L0_9RHOB|nr:alpha/beta hydrolase [Defluviimonas salinarum]MCW3782630.1 alpha/beta hydrolase [Defluviimonas salinarum]